MRQVACEPFILPADVTCDCDADDETLVKYIDSVSDVLAIMSGGKVQGVCCDVVRPRRVGGMACTCFERPWVGGGGGCMCGEVRGITLRGPNPQITTILIDGNQFIDYAIVDDRLLVRSDGRQWPACANITRPASERGTFEIDYKYGQPIPQLAMDAAAEIVCVMMSPEVQKPKLPAGTRGISVAGVQITLESLLSESKRRTFLLPTTIRFLTVYAPDGPSPAAVYSPELEDGWILHRVR